MSKYSTNSSRPVSYPVNKYSLGLRIPHDVAIICIEQDQLASSLAPTPLSFIDQDPIRVGYEAARLLDQLMSGSSVQETPKLVPPVGVVERRSTQIDLVDDELVARAVEFIHNHLGMPLQVSDLQRHLSVSRRQLEIRFKKSLGCSPGAKIRRTRLAHVKRLLKETDLPMAKVAELSGFEYTEVMMRSFKREFRFTPGDFRKIH